MLKKIISLVLIVAIGGYLLTPFSPCDQPIPYRIGTVDPRFDISIEEFTKDIDNAAQIWNKAIDKQLFVYNAKGALSVSLVHDGRQTLTQEINKIEDTLDKQKEDITPKIAQYEKRSAEFKKRSDELNDQIESWNAKGGAPPDVYEQLVKQQKELEQEASELNAQAKTLNLSADKYNSQIGKLDKTVNTFNQSLTLKPEEGVYDPATNSIEVYFNISKNELVHTLTHELGHALGMDHNNNPKSILYPETTQTLTPTDDDLAALKFICRPRTMAEVLRDRGLFIYNFYTTQQ